VKKGESKCYFEVVDLSLRTVAPNRKIFFLICPHVGFVVPRAVKIQKENGG